LEDIELEDYFEDTLNSEFNLMLEDNSAILIARQLLAHRKLARDGRLTELAEQIAKLSQKKAPVDKSVKFTDSNNNQEEDVSLCFFFVKCIFGSYRICSKCLSIMIEII
jgi:hypothetical protein